MLRKTLYGVVAAVSATTFMMPANAADLKLTATAIGRPPIFSNTFVDVGEAKGYWKKAGLDVSFRWFQRGTDTAKAVVTGDVQVGYTATPPAVNLIASGAKIKVIAGMPNQDWQIASDDPSVKGCKDLKGKTVAADGINNARYLFLQSVVENCGLKLSDLKLINLANAPLVKAGIAGQVHNGVWHIDELAQVEFVTKKNWTQITFPPTIKAGPALRRADRQRQSNRREPRRRHPLSGRLDRDPEIHGQQGSGHAERVRRNRGQSQPERRRGGRGRHQVVSKHQLLGRQ